MHVNSIHIKNYKCYYDSDQIELKPGFNLFVGKNNVGKTSLLECLSLRFAQKPHLSIKTSSRPGVGADGHSTITVNFKIESSVLFDFIKNLAINGSIYIPAGTVNNPEQAYSLINFLTAAATTEEISLMINEHGMVSCIPLFLKKQAHTDTFPGNNSVQCVVLGIKDGKFITSSLETIASYQSTLWKHLGELLMKKIYCFRAERYNIGEVRFGSNSQLRPDASNLPEVLNALQGTNPERFKRYNQYVQNIFPEIKQISVRPTGTDSLKVVTWTIDPVTEREDLAIPLSESGTGIGQVLAILYVILEKEPNIIIIDELQSFLHPGAARKLIEILKQNNHHQYIVATHSSTIMSATNPETITLIQSDNGVANLKSLDKKSGSDLRLFLSDIGVSLSDVFGADNILWVEGKTEEICFPLIIEKILKKSLSGTNIVGVTNTGDFEGKQSKLILKIYHKLSTATALSPPALGFIFDREGKSFQEMEDLKRESKGLVTFINRRLYENYLLDPIAITTVINSIEGFSDNEISQIIVTGWISKARTNPLYWKSFEIGEDDININGAKLLSDLFSELSEQRVQYRKAEHSVLLTEWIIKNSPNNLDDIVALLSRIIK